MARFPIMAARNAEVPEDRRIILRIGVNLGDIIIDGDDIHGDGVNLAARLQAESEAGWIAISDTVNGQIKNRLDASFRDDGEHSDKNIAQPVRIWRWVPDGYVAPATTSAPDKPSIAVLPFDNMSGDQEQEYFSDGMTEDIITDLSKASSLLVIARNSSFAYKGQSPDIRRVCRELGVRYVLEGSVRRAGNRVRINAQLINGDDGGHIWAERYDRDLEDIFAVQDEVTREIVSALQVELTPVEISRRALLGKVNPEAYDCIYRARNSLWQFSRESMAESHAMCARAIEIDPNIAAPYAIRSVVICTEFANGWNNVGAHDLDQALSQAQQACDLDDQDPNCHSSMALCRIWRRELEEALRSAERAIELDPNYAHGYSALAMVLDYMGQHARAVDIFQKSLLRDPHHDMMLHLQGRAQMALGQYDLAEANFKLRISRNPGTDTTRAYLAALYGLLGRIDEAREVWRQLLEINPNFDVEQVRASLPYAVSTWFDKFLPAWKGPDCRNEPVMP